MSSKIQFRAENTKALIDWLNRFIAIDSSLVIETDMYNKRFIAKSSTTDKSFVGYSQITFDEMSLVVDERTVPADIMRDKVRMKLGILLNLDKFINVLGPFAKSEVYMTMDVLPTPSEDKLNNDIIYYNVGRLTLKGAELQMVFNFAEEQHFIFITDRKFFDNIYRLEDSIEVRIPNSAIKESLTVNDIYNNNIKKDRVEFSFEGDTENSEYISKIVTSDAAGNYKMSLIELGDDNDIQFKTDGVRVIKPTVFKLLKKYLNIFLKAVNLNESSTWYIPYDINKSEQNRVLIDTGDSMYCIGGVNVEDFETI